MRRCERRCEDEQMWRWADVREDIKMRRYKDEQMWRWADVREDLKMSRCEDEQMWKWEGVKMRRCEDEKMRYRPPLLEEPCAQTLSGTKTPHKAVGKKHDKQSRQNRSPICFTHCRNRCGFLSRSFFILEPVRILLSLLCTHWIWSD